MEGREIDREGEKYNKEEDKKGSILHAIHFSTVIVSYYIVYDYMEFV